jgi:hypothetical protein
MTNVTGIQAAAQRRRRAAQGQRAQTVNLPAPIGGWNARDSLAQMQPEDAVSLTNWFPTTSDVMGRQGYIQWATGLPGQVNTIMPYTPSSGSAKLFAASVSGIYDVTSGGVVGAPVVSGLTNDKWSYTNFSTSAGPFLGCVNGADGYRVYNGTTWQSVTSVSAPISITGVDPTTLSFITSFVSRVWFIQKNSLIRVVSAGQQRRRCRAAVPIAGDLSPRRFARFDGRVDGRWWLRDAGLHLLRDD